MGSDQHRRDYDQSWANATSIAEARARWRCCFTKETASEVASGSRRSRCTILPMLAAEPGALPRAALVPFPGGWLEERPSRSGGRCDADQGHSAYGCSDREELSNAIHAAHKAATAATEAKKAMRPMPLRAATTASMVKIPEVKSQKPADAASRWTAMIASVQVPVYSPLGSGPPGSSLLPTTLPPVTGDAEDYPSNRPAGRTHQVQAGSPCRSSRRRSERLTFGSTNSWAAELPQWRVEADANMDGAAVRYMERAKDLLERADQQTTIEDRTVMTVASQGWSLLAIAASLSSLVDSK